MAFSKNLLQGGVSAGMADAIAGSVAFGLTATPAGTQATALLVQADYNYVSISSGSAAVRLYAGQNGDSCVIINGGPSSMFIWPPSGAFILGTATNAAVTLSPSVACRYTCLNAVTWVTELSAGGNTA